MLLTFILPYLQKNSHAIFVLLSFLFLLIWLDLIGFTQVLSTLTLFIELGNTNVTLSYLTLRSKLAKFVFAVKDAIESNWWFYIYCLHKAMILMLKVGFSCWVGVMQVP